MGTVPSKAIDRLQFYENHETTWQSQATNIGTTTTAVTDMTTKATAARDAYTAKLAADSASVTATQAWHQAMVALSTAGSAIIDQIRAKAKLSGDGVYTLADLPAPPTPQPSPPPGQVTDFVAALDVSGAINLSWKCSSTNGGVTYQVWRRTDPTAAFAYIGGAGEKKFVDATVPAGSSQVTYQIRAIRPTGAGPWAQFNVNFGVGGSGAMIMSVTQSAPARIAA